MQVEIVFSLHNVHIYQYGIDSFILGESNSLIFNHFCVRQFMQFSFLILFSLLFFLCFFAFHPALGTPINAKKNQRSKNAAKKEITYNTTSTWTVEQRNCKIRDYFTVDSPLMSDKTLLSVLLIPHVCFILHQAKTLWLLSQFSSLPHKGQQV